MFSLFKKNKSQLAKSIFCFETFNLIEQYLFDNENFNYKVKGIQGEVTISLFSFPSSFKNEKTLQQLKKNGFNHSIDLLNTFYKKVNIGELVPSSYQDIDEYYYTQIEFSSVPHSSLKNLIRSIPQTFFIILCSISDSEEQNDFRMMYSNSYFPDYVSSFSRAKAFEPLQLKDEAEENAKKQLEKVLFAFFEYTKLPIPAGIEANGHTDLLISEPVLEDFEEFIEILSNGLLSKKEIIKHAKKLKKTTEKSETNYEIHEAMFEFTDEEAFKDTFWNSDWKFEAEDAMFFISKMLEEDFTFEYPPETYSHDLFPYINAALSKKDKELASIDTQGDNYLFFLISKTNKEQLLQLAQKISISIDTF